MRPILRRSRLLLTALATLVMAAAGVVAAAAGTAPAPFIVANDCVEHQAFVDGSDAAVAAALPARYTPVRDASSGRPLLFVRAEHCAVTLGATSMPTTMANFGVVIQSPDGMGCASGAPVFGAAKGDEPPVCNWYPLFWLADNARVVDWLRQGAHDFHAVYVPHLVFHEGALDPATGGAPFHFEALAPAPSQFTMDDVGRQRPGQLSVRGGYWHDLDSRVEKIAFSTNDLTSGDATGAVRAAPGSQMARLFGADERAYVPGYSSVAAERWGHGSYRKQLLGPPYPGERLDSFSGSCSLHGTVDFTPPATNTAGPLTYSYDGSGPCSGTLDGHGVSNVTARVRQAGRSQGSCSQAATTAPGEGSLTFPDGATIRYTLDFTSQLTEVGFDFYGERSGYAPAQGTFLTQSTPPTLALECAGSGATHVPLDITLQANSPLVSARSVSSGAYGRHAGRRARLHLAVRPRRACDGRRTDFWFRVTTGAGRPVPGAIVRFAGRRARTNRRGIARIGVRPPRSGRLRAWASKRGFRSGSVVVVIRR